MALHRESRELAQAIRRNGIGLVKFHGQSTAMAVVKQTSPLAVELTTNDITIDDDHLLLGAWARFYDQEFGIAVGDTLLLSRLSSGDWFVFDVVTKNDITPPDSGTVTGTEWIKTPTLEAVEFAAGAYHAFPWVHNDGDELLDLSTPELPTFVSDGLYAITANIYAIGSPSAPDIHGSLVADLIAFPGPTPLGVTNQARWLDPSGQPPFGLPLPLTREVVAGTSMRAEATSYSTSDCSFGLGAIVQRIS